MTKIAVIGAGIVGIATAYELALKGLDVTVFERNATVAEDGSFANTGILGASLIQPISLPQWPARSRLEQWTKRSGIPLGKGFRLSDVRWRSRWEAPPNETVVQQSTQLAYQLVKLSQQRLHELLPALSNPIEQSTGQLLIFKSEAQVHAWQPRLKQLGQVGIGYQVLPPHAARKMEPGISPTAEFHSALHFEIDEVINCRQWAHVLKEEAGRRGASFRFNTMVRSIRFDAGLHLEMGTETPPAKFDAVVVCCAQESKRLLESANIKLALTPLHGHSVSGYIKESLNAPRSAVLDATSGVSMVRAGNRVRVSGAPELGAAGLAPLEKTLQDLYLTLQHYFPGATHFQGGAQTWRGTVAMTPDGLPLVGATSVPGLWLNTGHGMHGVGMANACASLLADAIQGQAASMDIHLLSPQRFAG